MYFWMVRLHTRMSSFSNSPRMRSAPHSRLSQAIRLISSTVSVGSFGLREAGLDFLLQNGRKPALCQRSKVSGCTTNRAFFQVRSLPANSTSRARSALVSGGRLTWRRRTMSCWRSRAFSSISCCLLRQRSIITPAERELAVGLLHIRQSQLPMLRWDAGTTTNTKNCTNSTKLEYFSDTRIPSDRRQVNSNRSAPVLPRLGVD